MKKFIEAENQIMDDDISSNKSIQTLLVFLFLFFLIAAYLFLWIPNINSMNTEVTTEG